MGSAHKIFLGIVALDFSKSFFRGLNFYENFMIIFGKKSCFVQHEIMKTLCKLFKLTVSLIKLTMHA